MLEEHAREKQRATTPAAFDRDFRENTNKTERSVFGVTAVGGACRETPV